MHDEVTEAFSRSMFARELLGEEVVDAELVIRRLMSSTYADTSPEELARKMRFTW